MFEFGSFKIGIETIFSIAAGSLVTIIVGYLFFLLQERRTKSAELERVEMANDEYMTALVRLFVFHGEIGSIENIVLLFLRKARQYRVDPKRMISPLQAVNDVYARIMENEYISKDQKVTVLKAISELNSLENSEKYNIEHYTSPYILQKDEGFDGISAGFGFVIGGVATAAAAYSLRDLSSRLNLESSIIVAIVLLGFLLVVAAIASILFDEFVKKYLVPRKVDVPSAKNEDVKSLERKPHNESKLST